MGLKIFLRVAAGHHARPGPALHAGGLLDGRDQLLGVIAFQARVAPRGQSVRRRIGRMLPRKPAPLRRRCNRDCRSPTSSTDRVNNISIARLCPSRNCVMRSAATGSRLSRPEKYCDNTDDCQRSPRLETNSITMIFDWMLNFDSGRPCRCLPIFTADRLILGVGSAKLCAVNRRPFRCRAEKPRSRSRITPAQG